MTASAWIVTSVAVIATVVALVGFWPLFFKFFPDNERIEDPSPDDDILE